MKFKKYDILSKEVVQFYALFALTVFFVYFTPVLVNRLYFLLLLVLFWKSRRDYLWLALVFVMLNEPAFLFGGGAMTDVHRVPLYNITAGISLSFYDLFLILAFLKALVKGKSSKILLKKPLQLLLLYLVFVILLSFVYGITLEGIIYYSRLFTMFTLFLFFPFLVKERDDFFSFIHCIFPIVFFVVLGQLYFLYTGHSFQSLLLGTDSARMIQLTGGGGYDDFIRPVSVGAILVFFSYVFSLFFITKEDYQGSRWYLYVILTLSILSVYISATRAWIVMFAVVFLLYGLFAVKKKRALLAPAAGIAVLLGLFYLFVPRIEYAMENAFKRLSTIELLAQGDVTAGRTLIRITKRLPRVLEGFEKSPIFGLGVSTTYDQYKDPHVGNFNLLLQVGLVGFGFFLFFWFSYLRMIFSTRKKISRNNTFRNPLLVLVIGFLGMLILHFTSYQFFGYSGVSPDKIYFVIVFVSLSEFFVKEAWREEISRNHPKSPDKSDKKNG